MDASGGSGSNSPIWPIVEAPSSDGTTNRDIAESEVASKSTSFASNPKKVTAHKVVTQKVQTKAFPVKSPIPIRNCILGLAALHTWACTGNKTFGTKKQKDAIVVGQARKGKKKDISSSGVFRLAFNPRKSSHYKVVQAGGEAGETWIQIYSSETGNWSFCKDWFSYFSFDNFKSAIYWNDAFHWLEGLNREHKQCKLNMKDHDHPIMTSLEISHGLHRGRNFLESFSEPINDPILLLMKIPHMLHLEGKFFSNHVGVFFLYAEMILALQRWSIRTGVWSICLGEGEEDAFVVINLSEKIVKYNLISKTNIEIFDIGFNQMDYDDDDAVLFIPPFEVDPNLYEFIPYLTSV
ncbi:hypothetical protein Tco_0869627 [Tanacetum coccineum]